MRVRGGSKSRAQEAFEAGPLFRGLRAPTVVVDRLSLRCATRTRGAFRRRSRFGLYRRAPFAGAPARLLAAELDHYDPIIRAATARVLARLHASEAADKLVQGTLDSNAVVQRFAVEALGWIGEPRAIPQLRQLATQPKQPLRAGAYLALARLGSLPKTRCSFGNSPLTATRLFRRAGVEGIGRDRTGSPSNWSVAP